MQSRSVGKSPSLQGGEDVNHEIHHVLWFAGNGNFNSPADLSAMEEEIGYDLFDINTGYGIRPLVINGVPVEPNGADDAAYFLEEMIEERGRRLAEDVFRDRLSPERFLEIISSEIAYSPGMN